MQSTFERAIVVGGSSGIGEAIARELTSTGTRVALVARRRGELARVAAELNGDAGEERARVYQHDVADAADVPALFQQICRDLGGLDLIVYSTGIMPKLAPDEYTFAKDRDIVSTNVLGAMAWLNEAADRFARAGAGTIVGISSVSGDRGRRGNPAYHASKAALDAYLESLRHRIARRGVTIVTVKPGPVDTPITRGMGKLPLLISAEECARQTLAAARRGQATAYVPKIWRPIMFVVRHLPYPIFTRLDF